MFGCINIEKNVSKFLKYKRIFLTNNYQNYDILLNRLKFILAIMRQVLYLVLLILNAQVIFKYL